MTVQRFGGDAPPKEPDGPDPPGVVDLSHRGLVEFPAKGARLSSSTRLIVGPSARIRHPELAR